MRIDFFENATEEVFYGFSSWAKLVFFANLIILTGIVVSLLFKGEGRAYVYIYFLFPVFWAVWIFCVFRVVGWRGGVLLFVWWLIINASIFFMFVLTAAPGSYSSKGADSVVLLIFFPIILPFGIFVPTDFLDVQLWVKGETAWKNAFQLWIEPAIAAAIQSLVILVLSYFFRKIINRHKINEY